MELLKIREHKELAETAAQWFHSKWKIPLKAYTDSIQMCLNNKVAVPQWYAATENAKIIGGLGVIENDFHNRKDLAPNVCALYVESAYRRKGIAEKLLNFACNDMKQFGIHTLYLVTDHTSFYEQYGWDFLCMVQADGESAMARMYIHKT